MLALCRLHPPSGASARLMVASGVVDPRATLSPTKKISTVLGQHKHFLDVSHDEPRDLIDLIDRAPRPAYQRRLADARCADVMTRELMTVEYGSRGGGAN